MKAKDVAHQYLRDAKDFLHEAHWPLDYRNDARSKDVATALDKMQQAKVKLLCGIEILTGILRRRKRANPSD